MKLSIWYFGVKYKYLNVFDIFGFKYNNAKVFGIANKLIYLTQLWH